MTTPKSITALEINTFRAFGPRPENVPCSTDDEIIESAMKYGRVAVIKALHTQNPDLGLVAAKNRVFALVPNP